MSLGAIADRVRGYIPQTYQALANASYYGETLIQQHIDDVKFKLFATSVDYGLEATVYDRYVLRYVGKVCAVDIIPSAIDFWMDQLQSETLTGTDEQIAYPDRINALEKTYAKLTAELDAEREEFESWVTPTIRLSGVSPLVDTSNDDEVTSDPADFVKEYGDNSLPIEYRGLYL